MLLNFSLFFDRMTMLDQISELSVIWRRQLTRHVPARHAHAVMLSAYAVIPYQNLLYSSCMHPGAVYLLVLYIWQGIAWKKMKPQLSGVSLLLVEMWLLLVSVSDTFTWWTVVILRACFAKIRKCKLLFWKLSEELLVEILSFWTTKSIISKFYRTSCLV